MKSVFCAKTFRFTAIAKVLLLFFGVLTWLDLLFIILLVNLAGFNHITPIDKSIIVICAGFYFIAKASLCYRVVHAQQRIPFFYSLFTKERSC